MGSLVRRITRTPSATPRPALRPQRRLTSARARPAQTPAHGDIRDDRQLIIDALQAYAAQAKLADHQLRNTPMQPSTAPALQALGEVGSRVEAAQQALAEPGMQELFAGRADAALIDLLKAAMAWYLEDLQSSSEMLLACEFGEKVLEESEESLQALSRRMDPLYDAACDLRTRLDEVGKPS